MKNRNYKQKKSINSTLIYTLTLLKITQGTYKHALLFDHNTKIISLKT